MTQLVNDIFLTYQQLIFYQFYLIFVSCIFLSLKENMTNFIIFLYENSVISPNATKIERELSNSYNASHLYNYVSFSTVFGAPKLIINAFVLQEKNEYSYLCAMNTLYVKIFPQYFKYTIIFRFSLAYEL